MLRYGIGLDIGITSVGWSVLSLNENDEPNGIVDLGVRIFDRAEIPKTGESLAKPRREARSQRRRLRRRKHRVERVQILLSENGIIDIGKFKARYYTKGLPDIYELRHQALNRKLNNDELAQILVYMAKHRGFKSNRKSELKDSETGKLLKSINENKKIMQEKGYLTVGEMIYQDSNFKKNRYGAGKESIISSRNKQGEYKYCIARDMLEEEVKIIFSKQREFSNEVTTEELEEEYLDIMLSQRSFDQGPGNMPNGEPSPYAGNMIERMIGSCTFEKNEKRASKATFTAESYVLYETINHTNIVDSRGDVRGLREEEKDIIVQMAYNKAKVTYADVRKKIHLGEKEYFKGLSYDKDDKNPENKRFVELKYWTFVKKIFDLDITNITDDQVKKLDEIGTILTVFKSDDKRKEELRKFSFDEDTTNYLLESNFSGFNRLSLVAMNKILPFLKQGFIYSEACEKAGYGFKNEYSGDMDKKISGDYYIDFLNDITNPVVKRSVSQTVKVVNSIIDAYGSPVFMRIELAREMSKNFKERMDIKKHQETNEKNNQNAIAEIKKFGIISPTGQDIVKYKLWKEQDGIDYYTGKSIEIKDLFKDNLYQVDHILPYSRSFDDGYNNKIVTSTVANQEKGNRTPFEWMKEGDSNIALKWEEFVVLIERSVKIYSKKQHYLKEKFGREEAKAFKERNLSDTKYITRAIMNLVRNHLYFEKYNDDTKKQHVFSVNGVVTAYVRKRWGFSKSRDTDRHHALDAVVIASTTPGMINTISRYVQGRELRYAYNIPFTDQETGEIFSPRDYKKDEWDEMFGKNFPVPWRLFKKEVEMRMSRTPEKYLDDLLKEGYEINKDYLRVHKTNDETLKELGICTGTISPFFVSRMVNHKVKGKAHKDTMLGAKYFGEGKVIEKVSLEKLNIKDGKIVSGNGEYFNPQDDLLLYNALYKRLEEYGGKGEKAFKEPFYKPKKDGSAGPLVKRVKIISNQSMGVYNKDKSGIYKNEEMVRIDIFKEDGKYYIVPIYTSDVVKGELPNKAIVAHKKYNDWKEMKEENFLFSLYSRDVIYISNNKLINLTNPSIKKKDFIGYYMSCDIASANIKGVVDDNSDHFRGLGIQKLNIFEKYRVDILGMLHKESCSLCRESFSKR